MNSVDFICDIEQYKTIPQKYVAAIHGPRQEQGLVGAVYMLTGAEECNMYNYFHCNEYYVTMKKTCYRG